MPTSFDFLVARDQISRHVCVPGVVNDDTPLASGQALLTVDEFAFTSNNVTYARLGDAMNYWRFFPAEEGWGRIPVWGFGTVRRSANDAIAPGERHFGYFPMSTHVVLYPVKRSPSGFFDGAPHRANLHPLYNQYLATTTDPLYDAQREAETMLLRPLFVLSFLVDDFLEDNDFFGARNVVVSSASSKTAYGIAFLLERRRKVRVIGLTARRNVGFVERLGCYDTVLSYDEIAGLVDDTTVYVDVAGNRELRRAVHTRANELLRYSCSVGLTHGGQLAGTPDDEGDAELPGPKPEFFFAPRQMKKRSADWGAAGLQRRIVDAWRDFLFAVAGAGQPWLHVHRAQGPAALARVVDALLAGHVPPEEGHVLTLIPKNHEP